MSVDRHGQVMTDTGAAAVRHYEKALEDLLFFREEVSGQTGAVLEASPRSAMGHVLRAYLALLGTEEKDAAEGAAAFRTFYRHVPLEGLSVRERLHAEAASAWLAGDLHRAGRLLGELTVAHPKDILALAVGHQIDFFTGNAVLLRDRIGGALASWDRDDPHYGLLQGMYAFGLEECGHYALAEQVGLEAVERNARDVWGIHAVVHAYEMQGRHEDGIGYLDARTEAWSAGNYLNVHNWWHYALYLLETGRTDKVLAVYDAALHHEGSPGAAMELLDAAALLWRLQLAGTDTGGRWPALAEAWARRGDGPHYAFNDVHAVMAYVGAGRIGDAQQLIGERERWLREAGAGPSNVAMTAEIGLPVCRALVAYGQRRYADVVDLLLPLRYRFQEFGGSHAQRDALHKTLVEAVLHAGAYDLGRALLSERISLRSRCPYNQQAWARLTAAQQPGRG
ncbi:tetratricopeptide repeat protein [Streptomyces sp. AN091965]|uniref:tetratricopeptide repeat protein n=1 Tax=Streptomyces sp. AN091965 TaxID=2927803 RepID=UPI001F62629F|nr:tetratricopeptide repeat protein [Streptomyces sp. AN091965]MCI3927691.1 tetratricopeptide repeat protein [Streptomyces sp. AN091965]MCI3927736.1 tetratricopeptide repeat protein [Streptomyces sp. AN091965]